MQVVTLFIGLVLGIALGYLFARSRGGGSDVAAEIAKNNETVAMRSSIDELTKKLAELNNNSVASDAAIRTEIKTINESATKLAGALANSQTRGKYGEAQLERLLEFAGLQEGVDYERQRGIINSDGGAGIPDIKISMPSGFKIYIDSKFPFTNYFSGLETNSAEERAKYMKLHADDLLKHVTDLAKRKYDSDPGSANFVVVFAPFESILAEALTANHQLLLNSFEKNVTIVGPANMLALLRTVSMGYSRDKLAENAHQIQLIAGKLVDKIEKSHEHLETLGKRIASTATAYNQLVGTVGSTVTKDVREMIELGLPQREIAQPKMINPQLRQIGGDFIEDGIIDAEAVEEN